MTTKNTIACPSWCTSHRYPNPTPECPTDDVEWHAANLVTEPFELTLKEDVWQEGWDVPAELLQPYIHFETATSDQIIRLESIADFAARFAEAARRLEGLVTA